MTTAFERETIIRYDETGDRATVYTAFPTAGRTLAEARH